MKIKRLLLSLILSIVVLSTSYAQVADVKVNALMGAVAIVNPSIELGFGERSSITMDYVGAYAKSNYMGTGHQFVISMALFGYRHYLNKDTHSGLFVGGDFGLFGFSMNKAVVPFVANDHESYYEDGVYYDAESYYDVGYGYLLGVTVGYKYLFTQSKRWGVELSLSGGWQLAQHEQYSGEGVRLYEYNPTAEWLPYKAGIYLSYRLIK